MTQGGKSQGWEGGFTPANRVAFNLSGGKPPFLTLSFLINVLNTEFVILNHGKD